MTRVSGSSGRGARAAHTALIRRYDAYLQVLRANADVLELLSELEEVAARGVSCGRRRFRAMVTRLGVQVYAMARMLRTLGGSRYDALFPAIEAIRGRLEQALAEPTGRGREGPWLIPLGQLAGIGDDEVGGKTANLGRLVATGTVDVPEGFAVSVEAFRSFLWHNGLEETIRLLSDTLDADEPLHLVETAERLQEEVRRGSLPGGLEEALLAAASALLEGRGQEATLAVRSSASGEDGELSFAGQYTSVLGVPAGRVVEAYRTVLADFFNPRALMMRLRRGHGPLELGMGALVMRMVDARAAGVAYSCDPLDPNAGVVVVEAVTGPGSALVSGSALPFSWRLPRAALEREVTDGPGPGGVPLAEAEILAAARLAAQAGAALGHPADVEWAVDHDGRLWLLQARPLTVLDRRTATEAGALPDEPVLLAAGVCASPGVGAGTVTRVRGRDDAVTLPRGHVIVTAEALPDLALALPRAAAVVAERGAVTGHLAATARELGVPALVGAEGAIAALAEGTFVTVDADGRRVYAGRPEALVARPAATPHRPAGRLAELAGKVMPDILPLNLLDPSSEEFTPANCRTIHDVVRFIHEMALLETVGDGTRGGGGPWFRVAEPLHFDLRLVPLDGGVEARAATRRVTRQQVTSLPARAFLDGLLDPEVQRRGPPPVDPGGFLAVVAHSALDRDLGDPTWAMVSDRYLQLSSRIGYHFATLEAYVGERPSDGRVRFVFRGGAADDTRRGRRARFIGRVLEGLSFQVVVKGDFVSGLLGHGPEPQLLEAIRALGRLLVCASRLDMLLANDTLAEWWADRFLAGDYASVLGASEPPAPGPVT